MILSRYLAKEIIKTQLVVLFVLLLMIFCQQLVRVLSSAVSGQVPADLVVSMLGLSLPSMTQLIMPISIFFSVLFCLGRFYADSEITVMRSVGVGTSLLNKVVLSIALLTTVAAAYNIFWLTPWSLDKQQVMLAEAKANPRFSALTSGKFMSAGGYVLFIENINNAQNQLNDVFVFQPDQQKKNRPSVVVAETGELQGLPNGDQLLTLQNSTRYEGTAKTADFRVSHFENYSAYLGYNDVNTNEKLMQRADWATLWNNNSVEAKAEFYWRLTLILSIPIMAFIAVPLSKVNPRQGRWARIVPAILIYVIFYLSIVLLKTAATTGKVNPALAMYLLLGAFLAVGIGLNSWETKTVSQWRYRLSSRQSVAA